MTDNRRITATILLTDVVGSTAQRVSLGEERADVLRRAHDDLMSRVIRDAAGTVVKGSGDGVLALFHAAADALDAAVAAQQALQRFNRGRHADEQLAVRMGVAVGDVSLEDGDCFGTPVVEAARLEACAGGGQILCSELVRLMARGRGGHRFEPMGVLELKGLPEPVAACVVRWEAEDGRHDLTLPAELAMETATPFAGRRAEQDALRELTDFSVARRIGVAWLHGEPGIGKTRLAAEIARRSLEAGALVLFGRCSEDLAAPYQPFVEALRGFCRRLDDEALSGALGRDGARLARLLPELTRRDARLVDVPLPDPGADQYHLLEAVLHWLLHAAEAQPVVVVLDDVHWATKPTRSMLAHLARSAEETRVLLICTARDTAPDDSDELRALHDELHRYAQLVDVALGGLSLHDVIELVGDPAAAVPLHRDSAGNPLFLEALRAGQRNVVDAVRQRVARLPAAAQALVELAAVCGLEFDLAVVAAAADRQVLDALEAIEAVASAGLVQESAPNRFLFSHALVRAALVERLTASRRAVLHHAISQAFERVAPGDAAVAATIVHHERSAGPHGDGARIGLFAERAAAHATTLLSFDEAAEFHAIAAEQATTPDERAAALVAQGETLIRAGRFADAHAVLATAAALAMDAARIDLHARAALGMEEATWRPGLSTAPAIAELDAVLRRRAALDAPTVTKLLASAARAREYAGLTAAAIRLADEALAMARASGDDAALGHALLCAAHIRGHGPEAPLVEELAEQILEVARRTGDEHLLMHGTNLSFTAPHRHPRAEFDARSAALAEMAARRGDVVYRHIGYSHAIFRALGDGEFERVEQLVNTAAADEQGWSEPEGLFGLRMFVLRREQDRLGELAPSLRVLQRLQSDTALWDPGLALLCVELGQLDDARRAFERIAAQDFARLPRDGNRLFSACFLAEVCCALGDVSRARWLRAQLLPYRGQVPLVWGSGLCAGPIDRLLGRLHATIGDLHAARTALEAALATCRFIGTPLWEAHSLCDLGAASADRSTIQAAQRLASARHLPLVQRRARQALAVLEG